MNKHVLTVTVNPAVDKTVVINHFRPGHDHRCRDPILSAGGKGINVARVLHRLGVDTLATGFLGGEAGCVIMDLLKQEGMEADFLRIKGRTRINLTIADSVTNKKTRILESGPKVTGGEIRRFKEIYRQRLRHSRMVVLSGRIAKGASEDLYAQLIRLAHRQGVPSVLDTSGKSLAAGLRARPFLVKPNLKEAEEVLGRRLGSIKEIEQAVSHLHAMGIQVVIVSMDKEGAIGSNHRELWHARAPQIRLRNDVGCGDALIGGFLNAYFEGKSFGESLRRAVAAGSANAVSLVPGAIDRRDILKLSAGVQMKRIFI